MLCYNSYSTLKLGWFLSLQAGLWTQNGISHVLEIKPNVVVRGTFKTYEKFKNLNYLCSRLQKLRSERNDAINRSKTYHFFKFDS